MEENGCKLDINLYNIILNGLVRIGGLKRVIEMFEKIKNLIIKLDVVLYNIFFSCFSRGGMFEEFVGLMKEMDKKGFKYDLIIYLLVFEAVGKIDDDFIVINI